MSERSAELARLREVAEAATVGPWSAEPVGSEGHHVFGPEGSRAPMRGRARVAACTWQDWEEAQADATYIATFDPPTILALLDRAEVALPDVETVAAAVHEAWMGTKRAQGVTSRPSEWGEEQMVPYADLSERAKDLDRGTVQAVYAAIAAISTPPASTPGEGL